MPQYGPFYAEDYAIGTKLSAVTGFASREGDDEVEIVQVTNGAYTFKLWRRVGSAGNPVYTYTPAGDVTASEVLMQIYIPSAAFDSIYGVHSSHYPSATTYYRLGARSGRPNAERYVDGSFTAIASGSQYLFGDDVGGYAYVRSQRDDTAGSERVRVRAFGKNKDLSTLDTFPSEPSTWDVDAADSAIATAGEVGVSWRADSGQGLRWISFGTNGDPAPTEPVSGGTTLTAQLTAQESGQDSASLSATSPVVGALSISESGSDTAAASASVFVSCALTALEDGADTYSGQVSVVEGRSAQLSAQESVSDSASGAALVSITGSVGATEAGKDAAALSAVASIRGSLSADEAGKDAYSGNVVLGDSLSVTLTAQESGSDSADGAALVVIQGGLLSRESGSDSSAGAALVLLQGGLSAREMGSDVYSGRSSDAEPYRVTAITGSVPESRIIGAIPSNRIVGAA